MRTIAISSKDIQPNSNNSTFHYVFPQSVVFKNQEIALSSLTMFNSVYNISSALNNNKFQYIWNMFSDNGVENCRTPAFLSRRPRLSKMFPQLSRPWTH